VTTGQLTKTAVQHYIIMLQNCGTAEWNRRTRAQAILDDGSWSQTRNYYLVELEPEM